METNHMQRMADLRIDGNYARVARSGPCVCVCVCERLNATM